MKLKILVILVSLLIAQSLHAEVREYTLSNGLKVIMTEDHKSPLAVFQIWYKVGSRNEQVGKSGLSHLLEHMMFKGTSKYGPKELSKLVQRYGGTENAFTTKDYTVYYQRLPSERIGLSIEIESDRMQNLTLDPKETTSELSVVMEERRLRYEDDPENLLFEDVMAASFKVYPYHWPVIGWMSDLKGITPEDLRAHYKRYYCPNNSFIVIAGDIEPDKLITKIEEGFGKIPPCPEIPAIKSEEPPQRGQRRVILKKEAELPYVLSVYHAPSFPEKDAYALEVLASVLSGGKSGRLYKNLIYERKLALSAFAGFDGTNLGPALFYIGGSPAPGKDLSEFENALYEELQKIITEPPTSDELRKAKNQIESSFIMNQDSIFFQAELIGMYEMMGDWRLKDRYIQGIREVGVEDLKSVIDKYLTEDRRTVGVLVPVKESR